MKRILITGMNSFIGKSLVEYLENYNTQSGEETYQITGISQRRKDWLSMDFAGYDTILDVTGISRVDEKKVSYEQEEEYYEVNYKLAYMTAEKAKKEGVRQFIYLSSILVYGEPGQPEVITKDTKPAPANIYGKSKLLAEEKLKELNDLQFQVGIIRLPTVYGPYAENGYKLLSRWAGKLPLIPTIPAEKSMIYIENLCEFLRLLIEAEEGGVYFPQNATQTCVARILEEIRTVQGKKTYKCGIMDFGIKLLIRMPGRCGKLARKVFAGQAYEGSMSVALGDYQVVDFPESIRRTEGKRKW